MAEQTELPTPQLSEGKPITATRAKFVDSPNYHSFYCNNVGFAVNQLDIVLYLNEILEISPSAEATIERRARVTMNPAQAKALMQVLDQVIRVWETQNGPVRDITYASPLTNES
ncbi:MAG TPA: DUF3467 domain-containing protein [Terracidiphilus sp.]|nr:DUF3467 domain-containing protein [Terracidiphilus sp.]